jgi:4-diphosphocytidyl-2-C-methyl-D-erythritol kinase
MHPISSWMLTIDLFDEIELVQRNEAELSMYAVQWHREALRPDEIDWPLSRDLAARAHTALERHVGRPLPLRLKIEKRIPLGSGLGGGSADAAAVLRGTNELFDLDLSLEELAGIASGIGSDVPFLVHGGSAIVEGLGDKIDPLGDVPEVHAVVALPRLHCPTARVYGWFDDLCEERGEAARNMRSARTITDGTLAPDAPFNDLAEAAFHAAPELSELCTTLGSLAERPAHVSGSGSSLFVLCDEQMHAEALASTIQERMDIPAVAVSGCACPTPVNG